MVKFGKCEGYTGKPCPNCGRYRVERYEDGVEICEKCDWSATLNRYVPWEEVHEYEKQLDELGYWFTGGNNGKN